MRNLIFLLITFHLSAQGDFQGKAIYQYKRKIELKSNKNKKNISPERLKRMEDFMKRNSQKTFVLKFDKNTSEYKQEAKLSTPAFGKSSGFYFSSIGGAILYKNYQKKIFIDQKEFFGQKFLVERDNQLPSWELSGDTKKIGKYTCFKATLVKKEDNISNPWSFRKNKKTDIITTKKPKEYTVTVWYTPEIPVNAGPSSYWGLPGLILEVGFKKTKILCTEVVLRPKEKIIIEEPTKGKRITEKEYAEIITQKMKEMKERYGRRKRSKKRRFVH